MQPFLLGSEVKNMRLIDADELKGKITDIDGGCAIDGTGFDIYTCEVFELIDEVPTVKDVVERKMGEWIEHEKPKNVFYIECSECGCYFLHEHLVRNSFCPNCGADMRGE